MTRQEDHLIVFENPGLNFPTTIQHAQKGIWLLLKFREYRKENLLKTFFNGAGK